MYCESAFYLVTT